MKKGMNFSYWPSRLAWMIAAPVFRGPHACVPAHAHTHAVGGKGLELGEQPHHWSYCTHPGQAKVTCLLPDFDEWETMLRP